MGSGTKVVESIKSVLQYLRNEATSREDGNTEALIDRVMRDVNQLQPEYCGLAFKDMYGIDRDADEFQDEPGHTTEFTAPSYEKTGARDINKKPLPSTGENADAPFVSKSDLADADNSEEELTRSPKPGKGTKANP